MAHFDVTLAHALTELRLRHGLTQTGLALKLGIHKSVMNRVECGHRPLQLAELVSLAQVLDLSDGEAMALARDLAAHPSPLTEAPEPHASAA